jgi:hypothetical protein
MALPSLDTNQTRKIEKLISGWQSKLTWDLLVQRIESDLNIKTTRQTLNTYAGIKEIFSLRKQELRGKPNKELVKFVKSDVDAYERIQRLENENTMLEKRVDKQLAFIQAIADTAKRSNPQLLHILGEIKRNLRG